MEVNLLSIIQILIMVIYTEQKFCNYLNVFYIVCLVYFYIFTTLAEQ